MKRTISCLRWPVAACIALTFFAPPLLAAETEKDMDPRSGEKGIKILLGTDDLSPIRRRAMDVGPVELKKERTRLEALRKAGRFATEAVASTWTSLGPTYRPIQNGTPQNAGDNSGLASGVKVHPTDPKTIYVATAGGGVWKTTDGGQGWTPLTDDLGQLPIGAVAISTSRPQRVYAGIGLSLIHI